MQNYNKKISEIRIINVCNLTGVNIYQLSSVNGFYSDNRQLRTCNIFTMKQFRNKLCKMVHLLPTDMDKAYPEQLVEILSMRVTTAVTKPEVGKRG